MFDGMLNRMFDIIYRKVLSPKSLREKRQEVQVHNLQRAIDSIVTTGCKSAGQEGKHLTLTGDELKTFIADIVKGSRPTPSIIGITTDTGTRTGSSSSTEVPMLALCGGVEKDDDIFTYYLPLVEAGDELNKAFEKKLTSTALCFVADASSGFGSEMLSQIVSSCGAGMALIKEPAWMTVLANFAQQSTSTNIEKIVFGLCRLDAWRVRDQVGESRTVVMTLPGQSCTANLLPTLQKMFPCERHVFIYDGGIDSVSRGLRIHSYSSTDHHDSTSMSMSMSTPREISATVPISNNITIGKLDSLFAKLSSDKAGILEAWMSSVDAFLKLKHNEKKTGYIPFVCRLGFLMGQVGRLGNGTSDKSELALTNVLQYITGSRSRPLKDDIIQAAMKTMEQLRTTEIDNAERYKGNLNESDTEVIEECAFAHKGILIENKTLMDTVQPNADWSLKAAKKLTSCACCMPGEGDEDSDDEEGEGEIKDNGAPKQLKTTFTASSTYVDGKVAFAFDPSKFTGL